MASKLKPRTKKQNNLLSKAARERLKRKLPTKKEILNNPLRAQQIDDKVGRIPPYLSKRRLQKKYIEKLPPKEKRLAILNAEKSQIERQIKDQLQTIAAFKQSLLGSNLTGSSQVDLLSTQLAIFDANIKELETREEQIDAQIEVLDKLKDIDNAKELANKADEFDFSNDTHIRKTLENRMSLLTKTLDLLIDADNKVADKKAQEDAAVTTERQKLIVQFAGELDETTKELDDLIALQFNNLDNDQIKQEYKKRQDELVDMLVFSDSSAPQWKNKLDNDDLTNKKLLDKRDARRETLLREVSYLRALQEPWVKAAGGLHKVTQKDVDALNTRKGLNIENPDELRAMYTTLFMADYFVANIPLNRAANNWNDIVKSTKNNKKWDQNTFDNNTTTTAQNLDGNNLVIMNLSHVSEESSHVARTILGKTNNQGIIYFEAPYALNLHENPAAAVGAWINGTKNAFPKSSHEILVDAQNNGWQIMPVDATQILDGKLDASLLKATSLPKSQDKDEHETSQKNVPRQNYIARNILGNATKDAQNPKSGLILIGGAHLGNVKGGNLAPMLGKKKGGTMRLNGTVRATLVKRTQLRAKPKYELSDPK